MKRSAIMAALLLVGCSAHGQPSATQKTPAEVGQLAANSWALLECGSIAWFAEDNKNAQSFFDRGLAKGKDFIEQAKARPGDRKAILDKVPMIMSMRLQGPSPDFMLGRVWEATLEYTDDELNGRDTWSHQQRDPKAAPVTGELRKATAAQRFRDRNCELLK